MILKSKSTEVFLGEEDFVSDTGLELKPVNEDWADVLPGCLRQCELLLLSS